MISVLGEPCPENGRSPGSVSTHHSSPRSDTYGTYANSNHAGSSSNATPPEGFASHSMQTNDVVIHRKENEGFGFVIISSLNRPESGSTISKSNLCTNCAFIYKNATKFCSLLVVVIIYLYSLTLIKLQLLRIPWVKRFIPYCFSISLPNKHDKESY